jgi:predicted nucleic acid-binding protein
MAAGRIGMTVPRFVMDASAFLAYLMDDEPEFEKSAQQALDMFSRSLAEIHIPAIFPAEVGNFLVLAFRKKRITEIQYNDYVGTLLEFPAALAPYEVRLLKDALALANRHGLTVYDAFYLGLAKNLEASHLLTFDHDLMKAAKMEGIAVRL